MNIAFIDMVFIIIIVACVLLSVLKGFVSSFFGKATFEASVRMTQHCRDREVIPCSKAPDLRDWLLAF